MLQDIRYSFRSLRHSNGFTTFAVLSLALGIGGTMAVFSLVNATLIAALPFDDPSRLYLGYETVGDRLGGVSYPNFLDWCKQTTSFSGLAAAASSEYSITLGLGTERLNGELISPDYFALLGAKPQFGRVFNESEGTVPGSGPLVVISDGLWRDRFGSDPTAVGRTLRVNGAPFTVIGVMRPGFRGISDESQFWIPVTMHETLFPELGRDSFISERGIHWLQVLARLKPGATPDHARIEVDAVASRIAREFPNANAERGARIVPLADSFTGNSRAGLLLLLGTAAFVMLIAAANITSLALVRIAARERELAVRLSLGATRGRLLTQSLIEGIMLASAGGAAGLLVSMWAAELLRKVLPFTLPSFAAASFDWRSLAFMSAVVLFIGSSIGLLPTWSLLRQNRLRSAIHDGSRGNTSGSQRLRRIFVAVETALAFTLLIGAGLMLRSLLQLSTVDLGFRPDRVLSMRFQLPGPELKGDARQAFAQRLAERVESVPGVESAAINLSDPLVWGGLQRGFEIDGQQDLPPSRQTGVYFQEVSPKLFSTMGISLIRGRDFTVQDDSHGPAVAIVSESFARKFYPGQDPMGKRLKYSAKGAPWMTIVGIAADTRFRSVRQMPGIESVVYAPVLQSAVIIDLSLIVRAKADPASLIPSLRRTIEDYRSGTPIYHVATMEQRLRDQNSRTRSYMILLGAFAVLAFAMAALGIYGVMAYLVAQRTREIGVRIALGARAGNIVALIVRQAFALVVAGLGAGTALAWILSRWLAGELYQVKGTDPVTYAVAAALLGAVGAIASYVPARRALGIDPLSALRHE